MVARTEMRMLRRIVDVTLITRRGTRRLERNVVWQTSS